MGRNKRTHRSDGFFWDSAILNKATYDQYVRRLTELSTSMFEWKNLPDTCDERFLEMTLLNNGAAVFFKDEILGYLALEVTLNGKWNVYRVPIERRAYATNGYNKKLTIEDSVIIYNNYIRTNSILDIKMFARRLTELDRAIDVNARGQKHPVLILATEEQRLTMLNIYKEQGKLPVWHLHGCETDCMVGNPGIPPVADAIVKGFEGFDYELAFEAMKNSAVKADRGQEFRMKYGYIPCDLFGESVAYDLEYALADGALANAAKVLGKEDEYQHFLNRSKSYVYLFDHELQFLRGKDSKGNFRKEYSPFASTHRADDYCEGNGWQYTWLVPHDFKGLVSCFGSKDAFLNKLDELFTVSSVVEGMETSPDISGLIGQYAHGNEPSHHIIYFYTMAGQPWKTADKVREVLDIMYSAEPDGLSGNEDVGQMSSWYILSALGFYEVEPASGRYWFGTPLFDKASIEVAGGTFTVTSVGNSDENRYIQSVTLNGKTYTKGYIEYKDIAAGGELVFTMGSEPNVWYCANEPETYEDQRPAEEDRLFVSEAVEAEIERITGMLENPRLRWMFANCYPNTLDTTVHPVESTDGQPDTFVYTGDIPAMWLRDSAAQLTHYIRYANEDEDLKEIIRSVIARQVQQVCLDPYANAFNIVPNNASHKDETDFYHPLIWERKYEVDSLCAPLYLAHQYYRETLDDSIFTEEFHTMILKIVEVFKNEQNHAERSKYFFNRTDCPVTDTLPMEGKGNPVSYTGMTWSGFRPSDDRCFYGYLVPANMMAVCALKKAAELANVGFEDTKLESECRSLAFDIDEGIKEHGIYEHDHYGKIFVYETDGRVDASGKFIGRFRATGVRPNCLEKIRGNGVTVNNEWFTN